MKVLELPHRTIDYLCPVNGLCDIYEWKTQNRIPEELLFFSRIGFQMISQKRAATPKMIFFNHGNIGKDLLNRWKDIIGYNIISDEGKSFRTTLSRIKQLLDNDIPTILFGLDMYYLPYQLNFYHSRHIPGHVVLMVGYDDNVVYVHDNSKDAIQSIPLNDLQASWANGYMGISKKNAYFGIDLSTTDSDTGGIIAKGIEENANFYLNSPVGFMGKCGIEKFMKEFPTWKNIFTESEMKKIYLHIAEFTGSVLPGLPDEVNGGLTKINNPHQASRDMFSAALLKYRDKFGTPAWQSAVRDFQRSGKIIEIIVKELTNDILNDSFSDSYKYLALFEKVRNIEENAFRKLS